MNWRRGLYRVWLVLSALWALFLLYLFLVLHDPNSGAFSPGQDISATALWLVVPPSALLGIGVLVGWIARGFR